MSRSLHSLVGRLRLVNRNCVASEPQAKLASIRSFHSLVERLRLVSRTVGASEPLR